MEKIHTKNGYTEIPVFEFGDSQGKGHFFRSQSIGKSGKYKAGDYVEFLYLPDNPEDAKIDDFFELWDTPFYTGLFACINLIICLSILIWLKITGMSQRREINT